MGHWHDDEPCTLTDKECDEMVNPNQKQKVWRTIAPANGIGYMAWEIMEVIGEKAEFVPKFSQMFDRCADGTYVLVQCYHFWTKERAIKFLYDNHYVAMQELFIVSGMPDLTASEYKEFLNNVDY